jgi:hypothetical protein
VIACVIGTVPTGCAILRLRSSGMLSAWWIWKKAGLGSSRSLKRPMKKPKVHIESAPPRIVQRADLTPSTGYALVVDGHFKTEFGEEKAAKKAATELLAKYPMLRIEIYDASSKSRTLVK